MYNAVHSVTYFALIFKLVETPGEGLFDTYLWLGPFLGVQKNECFGSMKKLWIFLGSHYIGLIWGIISIYFRAFFLRQGTEWVFLGGHKISNIYLEMPDIPDIFYRVNSRCRVQAYLCRVSPPHMGRNDPRPKRPTKIGRIDSPPKFGQNDPGRNDPAETTHGRNDPDSLGPVFSERSVTYMYMMCGLGLA